MDNIDEWIKKVGERESVEEQSKQLRESAAPPVEIPENRNIQESSVDASLFLHFNSCIVISGYTGMFLSVTEREHNSYRISINGSGAGVDDVGMINSVYSQDTFVIVNAENPGDTRAIKNGSLVCIRHKSKFIRFSY